MKRRARRPKVFRKELEPRAFFSLPIAPHSGDKADLAVLDKDAPQNTLATIQVDPDAITTYMELLAALRAEIIQVTLAADIIIPEPLRISQDLAINLNGHSLVAKDDIPCLIDLRRGELTLTGEGKLFSMFERSAVVRVSGTATSGALSHTLLIVGEKVHLYAPAGVGIIVAANLGAAYGVQIDFSGEIIAYDGIRLSESVWGRNTHRPEIILRSGARIIADETDGLAIDAAGLGVWRLDAARLYGASGLRITGGEFRLRMTQIATSGIMLEALGLTARAIDLVFEGGNYLSENSLTLVGHHAAFSRFEIREGNFCGAGGVINQELAGHIEISGGEFSTDIETAMTNPAFATIFSSPAEGDEDEEPTKKKLGFFGALREAFRRRSKARA